MPFVSLSSAPLWALGALWLAACTREPQARTVTGPDGSPMLHVACGADQGACFELAGRGCPNGYKVFPIFDPRDNNFLVRCHAAPTLAALPREAAPAPTRFNEWPGANASVASKPAPATSGTRNDSEIDLGY